MNRLSIADVFQGRVERPYLIAEVGVNHNGDMDLARRTMDAAAECGVDAVKFQTFRAAEFMADKELVYEYTSGGRKVSESMYAMFERLELSESGHKLLADHARGLGIDFLSSAADPLSADLLKALGVPALKLASEDLINTPLLEHVGRMERPVLLSTGMGDRREVNEALAALGRGGCKDVVLLHCVSLYPTPDDQANLRRIGGLAETYGLPVGYSDHTRGITAAVAATALGACLVEKHFTLDRSLPGPDHDLSADPEELRLLVEEVKRTAQQLGRDDITPAPGEAEARLNFRRSIVAARPLSEGTALSKADLALRRPGTGLHPRHLRELTGRTLARALDENEQLRLEDLQ